MQTCHLFYIKNGTAVRVGRLVVAGVGGVNAEGDSRPPNRWDAGKRPINELLAAVRPRLHLCGHHHRFAETSREGVRSVCIDRINRSYVLIDASTLEYQKIDQ